MKDVTIPSNPVVRNSTPEELPLRNVCKLMIWLVNCMRDVSRETVSKIYHLKRKKKKKEKTKIKVV